MVRLYVLDCGLCVGDGWWVVVFTGGVEWSTSRVGVWLFLIYLRVMFLIFFGDIVLRI